MAKQDEIYDTVYDGQKMNENLYCEPKSTNSELNQTTSFRTLQPQPSVQDSRKCVTKCQGNCYEVCEHFVLTHKWRKNDNGLQLFLRVNELEKKNNIKNFSCMPYETK